LRFNPAVPAYAKQFARDSLPAKYRFLSEHLAERDYLLDGFTVADAYLVTTLGWAQPAGIDLGQWPVLARYATALRERPAVARALGEELALAGRG
jgi:glutathione S-transferase